MKLVKDYSNYLRIERAMAQNTVASYCSDVSAVLEHFDAPAVRLTSEDIDEYLASCP